jgi:release factor glutamine methyltransferase
MTLSIAGDLLDAAARRLQASGSSSARLDALLLLSKATDWPTTTLLAHPEWSLSSEQQTQFAQLVARREASEPIFYLLGEREFFGRVFKVDRRALIPRPETEALVAIGCAAVERLRGSGVSPRVLELGTGSGAVAITLAAESGIPVVATDVSWDALTLARENALEFRLSHLVRFAQVDLVSGLRGPFHVVLANLPYVPDGRQIPADVRDYEPTVAIFGGERGTEILERLLPAVRRLLAPGAELAVELDEEEQAKPMADLARAEYPEARIEIRLDASGYDRVLWIRLPP